MKIINTLSGVMTVGALVASAVLMMLTVADVFLRYVFNRPILGTYEMTEYVMVCLLLGMAPCALQGRHVRIDFVVKIFPKLVQKYLDIIFYVAGLGIVAIFAWGGFTQSLSLLSVDARSSMLKIPDFPFYTIVVFSYVMLFLAIVVILIRKIGEAVKNES